MRRFLLAAALAVTASLHAEELSFRVSTSGGSSVVNRHGQATFESISFGVTRPFGRFERGLMLGLDEIEQPKSFFASRGVPNDRAHGVSLSLLLRRPFGSNHGLQPYAEVSSGPLWTDRPVPAATSHINFLTQAGAGVVVERAPIPLAVGFRVAHISNAGLAHHNPGWNVVSITTETAVRSSMHGHYRHR
jgi:lipid A 3-O-deacylase PagL